jgi:hypothetical protein
MSRGLGRLQQVLWVTIRRHGKPLTFDYIRAEAIGPDGGQLSASFERSMRRALHRMVSTGGLVTIGDGGRADPYRYFINPLVIGMMGKTPEAAALQQALEADPGAERAAAKLMAEMFPQSQADRKSPASPPGQVRTQSRLRVVSSRSPRW